MEVARAKDELGNLSRSFDQMRGALKQSQEAVRMSTVGQVASSLIQDFRSPMRRFFQQSTRSSAARLMRRKNFMHAKPRGAQSRSSIR